MESRIILSLDGMPHFEAVLLSKKVHSLVAGGKANDLIDEVGASALAEMDFQLRMLDPKLHDIGNTMWNRIMQYEGHAELVTVHTSGIGAKALRNAAIAAKEAGVKLLGVTLLTDISYYECKKQFGKTPLQLVSELTKKAKRCGLHGIVCSPKEVKLVRSLWPKAIIVVPGVRSPGKNTHDQKRVGTPYQTIFDGADYIVVGREIVRAPDPAHTAQKINNDVLRAVKDRAC